MDEMKEYATFTITTSEGKEVELAVVDEFEFEKKSYVVGALIEGDQISTEGCFIYRAIVSEDDFTVQKITNQIEYEKIVAAYMEMEDN